MSDKQQPINIFVSLLTVGLLSLGVYWLITSLIDKLNSVDSDLGKALVTGGVTVSVAFASLVIGKLWEQQVKIQQDIREKRFLYMKSRLRLFSLSYLQERMVNRNSLKMKLVKRFKNSLKAHYLGK